MSSKTDECINLGLPIHSFYLLKWVELLFKLNKNASHVITSDSIWWMNVFSYIFLKHLWNDVWEFWFFESLINKLNCNLVWHAIPYSITSKDDEFDVLFVAFTYFRIGCNHLFVSMQTFILFVFTVSKRSW